MNFFQQVYELVQQVPPGYVTTYGDIASVLGTRDARRVGHALHANPSGDTTSCHRVVTKDGRLSESYAFGGSIEQYAKLIEEGVTFLDDTHVNLVTHRYNLETTSLAYNYPFRASNSFHFF
ncbi:MAG: methylated-DNA--[protein]-cysteine S-methyltransferase [Candidatus Moraniibacteriota bacterium]|nr:MAG: methylated-DNA--[protein]-cysteine S-methyltransferase [Candidatus Moranbacteria bacterium]